jgi:hypothetical protein
MSTVGTDNHFGPPSDTCSKLTLLISRIFGQRSALSASSLRLWIGIAADATMQDVSRIGRAMFAL